MFLESESNETILQTHVLREMIHRGEMLHSMQKCTTVKRSYNNSGLCNASSTV
jgi:hypothetical protein